jgi:uncharacterized protein YdeI (YjbR/CyaY-like superfamily)
MSDLPDSVVTFASRDDLWAWLGEHGSSHPGLWVRLANARGDFPSVTFHELLEAGIAFGWSESNRRSYDRGSYLQRFTPRRTRGTASERNRAIAARLERDGLMTDEGRRAIGLPASPS